MHVAVIALGDVGRSHRMQYHTLELLKEGYTVSLVGQEGEDLIPPLQAGHKKFYPVRFTPYRMPSFLRTVFPPLYHLLTQLSLACSLLVALCLKLRQNEEVDVVLVQSPPAFPTLFSVYAFCAGSGYEGKKPKLVIDWHNLGYYSTLPDGSFYQGFAKWYERRMALNADYHLCVSMAIKSFLETEYKVKSFISVLYDCPQNSFGPLSVGEQHEFLMRLQQEDPSLRACKWTMDLTKTQTLLTENVSGRVAPRKNRPVLVTVPTSWTDNEDVGLLLEALAILDGRLIEKDIRMVVCVTGRGPLKEYYQKKISKLSLVNISVHTIWLAYDDYPKLLACADVGISLHTSTSGLDLPRVVMDMFGCETSVCAVDFDCIGEWVRDKINSRVFSTHTELAVQLEHIASSMPKRRARVHSFGDLAVYTKYNKVVQRWKEAYGIRALPLFHFYAAEISGSNKIPTNEAPKKKQTSPQK